VAASRHRIASRRATSGLAPEAPRSRDPHGKWTVTRSAKTASSCGRDSAAATMKRAFGRPPRRIERAARREASAMDAWLASMPTTSSSGRAAARASTKCPSPVPRSNVAARQSAARSVS
jgi:hypothetical protein